MKRIIAWLLVLAMTATISIGATLAYLTDTDEDVNVMTIGNVKIDQLEYERIDDETANEDAAVQEFHDNKPLYPAVTEEGFAYIPGDSYVDWEQIGKDGYTSTIWNPDEINNELDKMVFVKNKGTYDAYVRTIFAFEAGNYTTVDEFKSMMHLNLNSTDWTWEWLSEPVTIGESTYFVATATYNHVLAPDALTEISLSQIALDKTATNADVEAFGETYQILVKTQAIQSAGFVDASTALNDGFMEVTADNIPWETDVPVQGAAMKNVLHYLNADPTGTKITTKVTNVIFGLNSSYPEIVKEYDGVLITENQDVPVYAYYKPNGANYDIYCLAADKIYTPKDSTELFRDMSALKTVDTSNLDVSRTENMFRMFQSCGKLTELDTGNWDTSAATNMARMFQSCSSLTDLDVADWDVSNVTNMYCLFGGCSKLDGIDVSNWDMGNVTDVAYMFWNASALTSLDTANWELSNVKVMNAMFYGCGSLKTIGDTENWDTSEVTTMEAMFHSCKTLEELNATNWDLSNVTTLKLAFYNCPRLKKLDVSKWDVSNVTTMSSTFQNCTSLTELDVSNWDTGNVTTFMSMFSSNKSNAGDIPIGELDVANWDTSSCTDMSYMFYGCGQLTKLDMSGWDVSNVTTMYHMFADCFKMVDYNFSGWDTSSVTVMDGVFNSNRSVKVLDLSSFDTQNVEDMDQMFDGCSSLENVIGLNKWDTSSLRWIQEFFTGTKVQVVDLSSFNMSNVSHTTSMFSGNSELTTIYVGDNWNLNVANLKASGGMFNGDPKLTGANGTTTAGNPTDATYARIDTPAVQDAEGNVITEAVPGYLTHIDEKPVTP